MSEAVSKALRKMARNAVPSTVLTGTVKAVDMQKHTCDVTPDDGGPTLYDVRLKVRQSADDKGAFSVPKVGSPVTVAIIGGNVNNLVVLAVEDIKEHIIRCDGDAEVRVKPNGMVTLNGEQYGGLVKVQELRSELAKVNLFLTTLRTAIQSAPVVANDGGASFKAAVAAAIASLQLPNYNGIESNKTKHGGV